MRPFFVVGITLSGGKMLRAVFFILTLSSALASSEVDCDCDEESVSSVIHNGITYTHEQRGEEHSYSKLEESGCSSELSFRDSSPSVRFGYSDSCDVEKSALESTAQLAISFKEIVVIYSLEERLRESLSLSVNINWKGSHWPLREAINDDEYWPENIYDYLEGKYDEQKLRDVEFIALLRAKILSLDVYLPFTKVIKNKDCDVNLSEWLGDPIPIRSKFLARRESLVEWGAFTVLEAKKSVYPVFKGAIFFDVSCKKPLKLNGRD